MQAGVAHSLWCLRSSGALMAVMVAVGVMNLTWCAVIAAALAAEKNIRANRKLLAAMGLTLVVIGISIAAHPPLLDVLAMRAK